LAVRSCKTLIIHFDLWHNVQWKNFRLLSLPSNPLTSADSVTQ
jgi:hypothetical protein